MQYAVHILKSTVQSTLHAGHCTTTIYNLHTVLYKIYIHCTVSVQSTMCNAVQSVHRAEVIVSDYPCRANWIREQTKDQLYKSQCYTFSSFQLLTKCLLIHSVQYTHQRLLNCIDVNCFLFPFIERLGT